MNNQFIYSVLQYKHSLALTESLNLGIYFLSRTMAKFISLLGIPRELNAYIQRLTQQYLQSWAEA